MFYYQIHVHAIVPSVQATFIMYSYVLMFIPTCLVIKINSSLFAILPQCLSVQTAPVPAAYAPSHPDLLFYLYVSQEQRLTYWIAC